MKRAAIYCRISQDDGSALGVARQEQDCRELVGRQGWEIVAVYVDNNVSATRAKIRPRYAQMVADLEAGKFDTLVYYNQDRLMRDLLDWALLLKLAKELGVTLWSVSEGPVDFTNSSSVAMAGIKAVFSAAEPDEMGRRIRRRLKELADSGQTHGPIPYGWCREGGQEVLVPAEAAVIKEIAERLLIGDSLHSITRDLNRRGVPGPNGGPWIRQTVRWMVERSRNAGILTYKGQEYGPGNWPAIYSEEVHRRIQALLTQPSRQLAYNHGNVRHYLSGIALCGLCGSPMRVLNLPKQRRLPAYVCKEGRHLRIRQAWVDGLIRDLVVARLSQPDALALFMPRNNSALLDERASVAARLDLVADQFAEGSITGDQLQRITAKLKPQLEAIDARIAETVGPDLSDLVRPDVGAIWDGLPLERRRAATARLLTVYVGPSQQKRGQRHFDPSRVSVVWKEA